MSSIYGALLLCDYSHSLANVIVIFVNIGPSNAYVSSNPLANVMSIFVDMGPPQLAHKRDTHVYEHGCPPPHMVPPLAN